MSDAQLIEALGRYPQRVANELEHRRAVAAVQAQLAKYRQQVRKLEEATSQQVRASQAQIVRINDAAHQLIFEGDVMIKSPVPGQQGDSARLVALLQGPARQRRRGDAGCAVGDQSRGNA